jgi:predicted RNase H-like HicB family nuclease
MSDVSRSKVHLPVPLRYDRRHPKAKRQFDVVIEKDSDGFLVAWVPALPGCHTQARSHDELTKRICEAIELCLEVQGAPPALMAADYLQERAKRGDRKAFERVLARVHAEEPEPLDRIDARADKNSPRAKRPKPLWRMPAGARTSPRPGATS